MRVAMLTADVQSYPASCSSSIIDGYTRIITSIQVLSFLNLQKSQERINNEESRGPQLKIPYVETKERTLNTKVFYIVCYWFDFKTSEEN